MWEITDNSSILQVLQAINQDADLPNFSLSTLRKILKHLNFKYMTRTRRSILIDRNDIISWRRRYLLKIKEYRSNGASIYYQDETWINEGMCITQTLSTGWNKRTGPGGKVPLILTIA